LSLSWKVFLSLADNKRVMTNSRLLHFPSQASARHVFADSASFGDAPALLGGTSAAARRLWAQMQRVAPYFRAALLIGEPGSGAELAAEALHRGSPSQRQPMRKLSAEAAESYFTRGHFAGGGIIFIEDVEALSPEAQSGLLRLMQMRGARQSCVIAAAKTDLRSHVSGNGFSSELATRLGGLRITLPALRDRQEDIPHILHVAANEAMPSAGGMQPRWNEDFLSAACAYAWPRNLIELRAVIGWLVEHCSNERWSKESFDAACAACADEQPQADGPVRMVRLEAMVQEHIRAVLSACFGNKQKAAEVLGISRSTLYRMLDAGATPLLQKVG
jgi:DNA-binding NtrC family response regulator